MTSAEIEEEAADWVARRERGDFRPADDRELDAWLDSSTAHRVAYVRLVTAWGRLGRLQALRGGAGVGTVPVRAVWGTRLERNGGDSVSEAPAEMAPTRESGRRPRWRSWLGAGVAVAASLAIALVLWRGVGPSPKSYSTAVGAISSVALADGSHVTLDTNSEIRVAWRTAERSVQLDRGNAFFEVAKNPSRPFAVEVGGARVVAVGTQFSVSRDQDGVRVLVTEGRVRIERQGKSAASATQMVAAGMEARLTPLSVLIDRPSASDIEQRLSWRQGYIRLRDTPLTEAVAEFNRYSVRQIVIGDPRLSEIRIGGNFRIGNMGAFLWVLQSGFPVHVEERPDPDRIILTKR